MICEIAQFWGDGRRFSPKVRHYRKAPPGSGRGGATGESATVPRYGYRMLGMRFSKYTNDRMNFHSEHFQTMRGPLIMVQYGFNVNVKED